MMEKFGTRGFFGFNEIKSLSETTDTGPPIPLKKFKVDENGDEKYAWNKPLLRPGGRISAYVKILSLPEFYNYYYYNNYYVIRTIGKKKQSQGSYFHSLF